MKLKHVLVSFTILLLFGTTAHASQARPDSFADLAESLLPAVVNISTLQEVQGSPFKMQAPQFPPGSPFEDLFKKFFEQAPGFPGRPGGNGIKPKKRDVTSLGSGFIVSAEGFIVTNNHVIASADEVTVILSDETELPAEVIGMDPKTDLALLKVQSDKPLPYVRWADSDTIRVGDWILAIGNPFGLGGTVTAGILSARARDINAGPYDDFLQTDASINRGNSGGPMFNIDGEVVGVNTAIFSPSGGSVGIGFAIPANLARPVIEQLKEYGRTKRGWLGVRIQVVTPEIAEALGLKDIRGAMVASVTEGGPADKAGLEPGDVVLSFDGKPIEEMRQLPRIVAETEIGKMAPVEVFRGGKIHKFKVDLGELEKAEKSGALKEERRAADSKEGDGAEMLGMILADLSEKYRDRFALAESAKGILVVGVSRTGAAAEKGIRPGDLIVEINQQKVQRVKDIKTVVKQLKADKKKSTLLRVIGRTGNPRYIVLPLVESKTKKAE